MKKNTDRTARRKTSNLKLTPSGASHLSKGGLRESGRLKAVRTTTAVASPLATGTIAGAVAVGFYGVANILKYKRNEKSGPQAVPLHIRNAPTALMKRLGYSKGYRYPHNYPGGWVEQEYLPKRIGNRVFYRPTERGFELEIRKRINRLKKK